MVHIEQILWPPTGFPDVKMSNINETELWIFKDRLFNNLCTVIEEPTGGYGEMFYTVFKDNAGICYGVYSSGNPELDWCYIREVGKLECGQET